MSENKADNYNDPVMEKLRLDMKTGARVLTEKEKDDLCAYLQKRIEIARENIPKEEQLTPEQVDEIIRESR